MKIERWMNQPVLTTDPDIPVVLAYRKMRENEIRRLPVVDDDGRLVGILAERDALTVLMPDHSLAAIASSPVLAVLLLALLAVLLSLPAEVGPFVAAVLTPFSLTARLAFLVVGPAVDLRRLTAQATTFGPAFALRFAPVTLAVAAGAVALVGWAVL